MTGAVPASAYAGRRDRLVSELQLDSEPLDAVLITDLVNIRYLTGFTGSSGALLISPSQTVFATDSRYDGQSARQCPDLERIIERPCADALLARAVSSGVVRVGFESSHVTVATHTTWLHGFPTASLIGRTELVEIGRVVKDEWEVALLRRACAISDDALAALLPDVVCGMTERDVARRLESYLFDRGADALSFETIVAAGENSAIPHHSPTDRALRTGDLLKIDFGAEFGGYHADMTRTFCLGSPAPWQVEIYDVVREAQEVGRAAVRAGADVSSVDAVARGFIQAAGFGEDFGHGLGHGVGLEIHEAPTLGPLGTGILAPGTPVTVEPGVYLEGRGGVRIEDTLLVTDGAPESLTTSERDLVVLG